MTSTRPIAVPVMGRIAAGTPIEAIQTRSHVINMPPDLLSAGEHFALEVRGDSHDRGRHSRWRYRADPQDAKPPIPATSWWR